MLNENLIEDNSIMKSGKEQAQDRLNRKVKELQGENTKLKYELSVSQSKEFLHKNTMEKVKQIQDDYEKAYQETYNDFKQREVKIKDQYQQYSTKLQSESTLREERLNEQINSIKAQLENKNELIQKQQNDLMEIIEKNSKNEITFHLKEKDYEALIISKERKQAELDQAVKSISLEANEKIQSLSKQLDHFQSKIQNIITLEDDIDQEDRLINRKEIMTTNDINHSLQSLDCSPLKRGQYQHQCPNDCGNKLKEMDKEIYELKHENERLYAENIEKDKEISYWKGLKQEFKPIKYSTRQNELYSMRNNYQLDNRLNDYGENNYINVQTDNDQNGDSNEDKERYQPNNVYLYQEYIPHAIKYKKINQFTKNTNSKAQRGVLNKSYMTHRHQECYSGNNENGNRIPQNHLNESGLALKHDTSMKELHIKIQALRNKLKA